MIRRFWCWNESIGDQNEQIFHQASIVGGHIRISNLENVPAVNEIDT